MESIDVFFPRASVFEFDFVRAFLRNNEIEFFDAACAAKAVGSIVGNIVLGEHFYAAYDH